MKYNSFLGKIDSALSMTSAETWARDSLQTAKDDFWSTLLGGVIFLVVVSGICFGILYLRFLVFGG